MKTILLTFIMMAGVTATAQNVGIGISTPQSKLHILPNTGAAVQIDAYGPAAGQTGEMRWLELPGNGTQFVGFKSPDAIPASQVWVLPPTDGANLQVLSTNGAGQLYWQNLPLPGGTTTTPGHCYTCDGF